MSLFDRSIALAFSCTPKRRQVVADLLDLPRMELSSASFKCAVEAEATDRGRNDSRIHPGKRGIEPGLADPVLTVARCAIEGDKRAMLGVASGNLAERSAGPGDPRGRNQGRLWLARGAGVGDAATDCAPMLDRPLSTVAIRALAEACSRAEELEEPSTADSVAPIASSVLSFTSDT